MSQPQLDKPLCLCPAQHLVVQETELGSAFSAKAWAGSVGFGTGVAGLVKSNRNKAGDVMSGPEQMRFTAFLLC